MLEDWAMRQSFWQKRMMWALCQGAAVKASGLIHATARSEGDAVRKLGIDAPVAVVPNGVDIPTESETAHFAASPRKLLFLGRIHPKKGIDRLLRAWAFVERDFPSWELHIVGPDNDDCLPALRALSADLELRRVTFGGAVSGPAKAELLRSAQLFILPTHSENFGITVAEALAHAVPAIVSRGAPWEGLERERCGYWIDNDPGVLAGCLRAALALSPAELRTMGELGRAWILRDFSWQECARMMAESYDWLRSGGGRPPWIVVPRGASE
jgi:glycosyltransferase involved in cell wall biosynthesis